MDNIIIDGDSCSKYMKNKITKIEDIYKKPYYINTDLHETLMENNDELIELCSQVHYYVIKNKNNNVIPCYLNRVHESDNNIYPGDLISYIIISHTPEQLRLFFPKTIIEIYFTKAKHYYVHFKNIVNDLNDKNKKFMDKYLFQKSYFSNYIKKKYRIKDIYTNKNIYASSKFYNFNQLIYNEKFSTIFYVLASCVEETYVNKFNKIIDKINNNCKDRHQTKKALAFCKNNNFYLPLDKNNLWVEELKNELKKLVIIIFY